MALPLDVASSLVVVMGLNLFGCSAQPREQVPSARAVASEVEATADSALAPSADGESESGGRESESGGGETGGSESDTGQAPGGVGARLCSRPYTITTPGKGAQTREDAHAKADQAAARERLERGLELAIDEGERQPWTTKVGVEFDALDPEGVHKIDIYSASGKRLKRMDLDFARRSSEDICLGLNSFYATWQLRALRTGARCGPCVTR